MDKIFKYILMDANFDKVLDIGCGSRPYKSLFHNSIGIDYNSGDIHATGENLPIKSESVDLVFSTQTLEHVEDPKTFLLEARRVLKPGGRIILSTHGTYPIHADKDYWRWTDKGLGKLFKSVGFTNIKITPTGGYWLCMFQLINCAINMTRLKPLIPIFNLIGSLDLFKKDKMVCVYVCLAIK